MNLHDTCRGLATPKELMNPTEEHRNIRNWADVGEFVLKVFLK
jgi:hypothetical protein